MNTQIPITAPQSEKPTVRRGRSGFYALETNQEI